MPKYSVAKVRSTIKPPRNLTSREKIIYKDSAGNKLYAKRGKDTDAQFSAKNAMGHQVNIDGIKILMRRWNRTR